MDVITDSSPSSYLMKERGETLFRTLLTEKQVGRLLNVKAKTIQAWRTRGGGPHFAQLGRCIRYRMKDIDEFVASRVRSRTGGAKTHNGNGMRQSASEETVA